MSLKSAKEALLRKHYTEAIQILQSYVRQHPDRHSKDWIQAQMWLVRAYKATGRADKAIPICEMFFEGDDPELQAWADKSLRALRADLEQAPDDRLPKNLEVDAVQKTAQRRYSKKPVVLSLPPIYRWLAILTMVTIVLVQVGLTVSLFVAPLFWLYLVPPPLLINWAIGVGLLVSVVFFFMSPWIVDVTQKQYQRTQWITLADLEPYSPEAVETIEYFCDKYNYIVPRLGWIESEVPIAFSYGILPNSARIVISRGLLRCLDDDEVAAVYGYHLGRICSWSFTVITFATAPLQIYYLIYVWLNRASFKVKTGNGIIRFLGSVFQTIYRVGNYFLGFVTRYTSYLNDRYGAEITGNPNALSRALAKMARALLEHHQPGQPLNRLLESTRSLGFLDYYTSSAVGMALQVLYAGQTDYNPYEVLLWELYNPWAKWLEWNSSHPLIAKRMAVFTKFAKQLGLHHEYEFVELQKLEKKLDKKRLSEHFYPHLLIQIAPVLGVVIGIVFPLFYEWLIKNYLGERLGWRWYPNPWLIPSLILVGLGLGFMFQGSLRYPNFRKVIDTDIVSLLTNPYTNCLQGLPVRVPGEIINYSTDDNFAGFALRLEDQGALMYVHYLPSYDDRGTKMSKVLYRLSQLLDRAVVVTGWYRRDHTPIIDLHSLQPLLKEDRENLPAIRGAHQFWNNLVSSALVLSGMLLLLATSLLF
jgi:Zn-dependent protease with chaperone function